MTHREVVTLCEPAHRDRGVVPRFDVHQFSSALYLKGLKQTDKGVESIVRRDDLDEVDTEAWLRLIKGWRATSPSHLCEELDVTCVRGVYN